MPGNLIYYALVLMATALVAALLGFGSVSATTMGGASLLLLVAVASRWCRSASYSPSCVEHGPGNRG